MKSIEHKKTYVWHVGGTSLLRCSNVFSDRYSCTNPTVTTITIATVILIASSPRPINSDIAALVSNKMINGLLNWKIEKIFRF